MKMRPRKIVFQYILIEIISKGCKKKLFLCILLWKTDTKISVRTTEGARKKKCPLKPGFQGGGVVAKKFADMSATNRFFFK